jgi:hypothetical protein
LESIALAIKSPCSSAAELVARVSTAGAVSGEIPFAHPSLARDLSHDGAIRRSLSRNANIASPTSYSDRPPSPRTKLADSNRHTDPDLWGHLRFGQAFITGEVAAHGSPALVLFDQKRNDRAN